MGKAGKQRAKERRERRRHEILELRKIPYPLADRWWSSETVAVVTGSNRGIGFEIARQLASHGLRVVVTSRDSVRGLEAAGVLREEGLDVDYCQLDVVDDSSVKTFADWILARHGGLDILVNNAGVNFNKGSDNSVGHAAKVIETNYFGMKRMIQTMVSLMKPSATGARILNVSSRLGKLDGRRNKLMDVSLSEQLSKDECLSESLINHMVYEFLKQVNDGSWISNGWPQMFTDYSVSKLAVNAYTRLMSRTLSSRPEGHKIHINCYCPGWVKTSMTDWAGNISAEEGADTGVWAVLLSESPTGNFFAERREISF
uniref:Short-chain dehydrogenase/reductase n=1 Tax=Anthurium amnicola TaxID=1678845 RepID=A0A1D1Y2M6_9ARAE